MLKIVLAVLFGTLCYQLVRSLGWRGFGDRRQRKGSRPFGKTRVIDADFEDVEDVEDVED